MIIGLSGYKQSGKDTVGQYLVDNYGFERRAFADKVKEATQALLGVTREQQEMYKNDSDKFVSIIHSQGLSNYVPLSGTSVISFRHFLQRVGTEMGRNVFGEDFWVDQILPKYIEEAILLGNVVITDCRFDNEVGRIYKLQGRVIRINRPDIKSTDEHVSEQLPGYDYDLMNEGTLEDLYNSVDNMMRNIRFS